MTKKEKLIKKAAEDLLEQNRILYLAEDNESRMMAAQRAYLQLGMLLGLCNGDYYAPELMEVRAQQEELFGGWAVTNPNSTFGSISDEKCKELSEQHKAESGIHAEIRYYERGFDYPPVPEITALRETVKVKNREELVELVKGIELPASAEYAHVFIEGNEEPSFAVTHDVCCDLDYDLWL